MHMYVNLQLETPSLLTKPGTAEHSSCLRQGGAQREPAPSHRHPMDEDMDPSHGPSPRLTAELWLYPSAKER